MNLNTVLELIMSFMYIINKRGLKMEPCGTPMVISFFCGLCVIYFHKLFSIS